MVSIPVLLVGQAEGMGGLAAASTMRTPERSCPGHRQQASSSLPYPSFKPLFPPRQAGISLVEIMISLVIGMILVAGVIQIYLASKQTYRVVDASSRIQENARFAMDILGHHLRMTGFRDNVATDPASAFPALTFGGYSLNSGEVIRGSDTEVVIRYQGDGVIQDCAAGNVIPAGTPVAVSFQLDANNELQCLTSLSGPEPLVSGVTQMRFLYGIDTDGDGGANCYDQASALNAANPVVCGVSLDGSWDRVVSLRIALELAPEENLGVAVNQPLRKSYSTTVSFRNNLP